MNNITPEQKAKAEQFIKNNIGPKSYKSNAYGELQMLYDFVKDNDLSKMNDEELKSFYIEISNLKNRLIDWVKTTPQKEYQFENIIFRIKFLYEFIYELLTPELLKEANNERRELNNAFDFELKPIGYIEKDIVEPNARQMILKAINEVESLAEKTSNKSSIKDKPKKEFKDLINKKYNWNDAEIETIKKDLLRGFQNNIVLAYNKGGKGKRELFNYVILYLMKNKIIDDRNFKDSECIKVFEDLFFDKKVDSFYANFIKFKSNVGLDNSKLNTSNYKNIFDPEISQIEKSNHLFKVR